MYKDFLKVFSFLPSEEINANELVTGDIALIHSRWILVVEAFESENYNNGYNFSVQSLDGGRSYIPSTHKVSIIKRHIVDAVGIKKFIEEHLKEVEKLNRLAEEEEKERIEEEKQYLRERLEALGD